ncbi:NAD(P)-dependent oxidoreductase [Sphingomonas baiyangensis]|uniref:NAD(P)-dependent oxidoreductase n=1 Tax=Sphingomonas baiyangensis TaxID=2572576 RepID=A0A4U1L705_9SPHN|nr:NAD(P)-dependent oxidoreductase [Sphingomonas baiyangensis]
MRVTVLVTGAQGFIGRYLVMALLARGDVVFGCGRSPRRARHFTHKITRLGVELVAPLPEALRPGPQYHYRRLDLSHAGAVAQAVENIAPTIVYHLAGSLRDAPFEQLVSNNIVATRNLCDALADSGATLVLGSSGSVYGAVGGDGMPLRESGPAEPIDPYAATKRTSEDLVRIAMRAGKLDGRIARIFNVVGPGQEERHVAGRIASQIADLRDRAAEKLALGPLTAWRDFIDVRDVAAALIAVGERGMAATTYNVASGRESRISEILDGLLVAAGAETPAIEKQPGRAVDIARQVVDVAALKALGWHPVHDLPDSLADVMRYYLDLDDARAG